MAFVKLMNIKEPVLVIVLTMAHVEMVFVIVMKILLAVQGIVIILNVVMAFVTLKNIKEPVLVIALIMAHVEIIFVICLKMRLLVLETALQPTVGMACAT
jgi:hypothetical protein